MVIGGPVTMSDVARVAGVSVMTVSNVLNDRPRVGAGTRQRVLDVVAELGYEKNLSAQRLRAGRNGSVALVVPRFDHLYFGELAAAFAEAFAQHGRHLVVEQSGMSREGELSAVSRARIHMYDGVLLSVVGLDYEDVDRLSVHVPVVLLGEKDVPMRYDHVAMANVDGAELATAHMLARGSRRVAIVGGAPPDAPVAEMASLRARGWRQAHERRGLHALEELCLPMAAADALAAKAQVGEWLARGVQLDGIFAVTDFVALGVLAALHEAGLRVPQDVQVVGFDALTLGEVAVPSLTTVDPGNPWLVEHATDLLLRRIAGDHAPGRLLEAPVRLVERASTRPA